MKDFLRRAFAENLALKTVALILAVTLFILVKGERDAMVAAYIKVVYAMPSDRMLISQPVDQVRVMVRGPWTRVKRFDERDVDPIYVDLSRTPHGEFSFQEDMIRLPPGLQVASINPPTIHLEFEKTIDKQVAVLPTFEGEPRHGFRIERTEVRPAQITIRGAKTVVDATSGVETRRVSVADRTSTFSERVALAPTEEHVKVVDDAMVEVTVTIAEEPAQLTLERIPVTVRTTSGAPLPAASVPTLAPAQVSLVLRGGKNAIETVDESRIALHVEVHPEDLQDGKARKAQVLAEGIPNGVGIEVFPREVIVTPR